MFFFFLLSRSYLRKALIKSETGSKVCYVNYNKCFKVFGGDEIMNASKGVKLGFGNKVISKLLGPTSDSKEIPQNFFYPPFLLTRRYVCCYVVFFFFFFFFVVILL
jgi:hypothetical protein